MGVFKLAAASAVAYGLYRAITRKSGETAPAPAAFAHGEAAGDNFAQVRSAGVEGMRSNPRHWDNVDQTVDESFPASDPPATY